MLVDSYASVYGLLALAAVILYLAAQVQRIRSNPLRSTPGPFSTLLPGLPVRLACLRGRQMQWTHSLHQQYGPVVRVAPNRVSIADPDAIKHIYNIKKPYYKTEFYSSYNGPDLTSTFSGRDPSAHQQSRRLLGAAMTESSLIANMEDTLREHVARWRSQLVTAFATKGFADIYVWNLCLATDFISTATFGSSFDMLNQGPEPRKHQYIQDLIAHPFFRYLRGIVPLLHTAQRWIPLPVCRQMVGIEQRRKASAREFLARRQRDSTDPSSASLQGPSLFTKYYAENEKGAHGIVPDSRLLSEALSYLGAGTDETTNTITVLFWEMAKHPEIQARLSREMNALPEGYRSNELRDAPLLNQVINETLRLDGAASSPLERYVPAGGLTTSDGQHIPAGCAVSVQAWTLHRDATVFEDPERFHPARWAAPTKAMQDMFLPFGGGTRVCLGRHLAVLETRHAVAAFYRQFPQGVAPAYGVRDARDVEEGNEGMGDEDMVLQDLFTCYPKGRRCYVKLRAECGVQEDERAG